MYKPKPESKLNKLLSTVLDWVRVQDVITKLLFSYCLLLYRLANLKCMNFILLQNVFISRCIFNLIA